MIDRGREPDAAEGLTRRDAVGGGLAAAAALSSTAASAAPLEHRAEPPAPAPSHIADLVGEYGSADAPLIFLERDGALLVATRTSEPVPLVRGDRGAWRPSAPFPAGARFDFTREGRPPQGVRVDDRLVLPRLDIGAEIERRIRAGVKADAATLRARALAASPPKEDGPHRRSELVPLARIDPRLRFDIRYATANNFMGLPLYERSGAWLQKPAAEALARVSTALAREGFGLLVFDGYRPWFVTKMFWDATPPEGRAFVADPSQGSRHNRGCAVDLTLCDLVSGAPVEMTGRYDEMSPRSFPAYPGGTTRQRWHRDLLRRHMEAGGFSVYPEEWWHFDYRDWKHYPIGNVTFSQLEAAQG